MKVYSLILLMVLLSQNLQAQDQIQWMKFEEAIAANVFGAPWYSVDGEGFWGQDRLEFVERALMGK